MSDQIEEIKSFKSFLNRKNKTFEDRNITPQQRKRFERMVGDLEKDLNYEHTKAFQEVRDSKAELKRLRAEIKKQKEEIKRNNEIAKRMNQDKKEVSSILKAFKSGDLSKIVDITRTMDKETKDKMEDIMNEVFKKQRDELAKL
jgi:hypothetical protein